MHRSLLIAALVAIIGAATADAATRRHKQPARAATTATTVAPAQRPQIGPPGAGPNQCWSDEGYGRYSPCDAGGKSGM